MLHIYFLRRQQQQHEAIEIPVIPPFFNNNKSQRPHEAPVEIPSLFDNTVRSRDRARRQRQLNDLQLVLDDLQHPLPIGSSSSSTSNLFFPLARLDCIFNPLLLPLPSQQQPFLRQPPISSLQL
ncbi:hypothetical protein FRX31_024668 [Thalictrum thalictroides]|uniref:Uncharacterized protein n=1 Tax=Thalictrum thalictroides TaxID=46969 RepID=A0A7J6VNI5_THATH|nr:hypothetical protein FRX31_024668 [Thalictrum thalictroides]